MNTSPQTDSAKRQFLTARQYYVLTSWLIENHQQMMKDPRPRRIWCEWATEALGFQVNVGHLKQAQDASGLEWPKVTRTSAGRCEELEQRVAALETQLAELLTSLGETK